jgi:hypothetical protein
LGSDAQLAAKVAFAAATEMLGRAEADPVYFSKARVDSVKAMQKVAASYGYRTALQSQLLKRQLAFALGNR